MRRTKCFSPARLFIALALPLVIAASFLPLLSGVVQFSEGRLTCSMADYHYYRLPFTQLGGNDLD